MFTGDHDDNSHSSFSCVHRLHCEWTFLYILFAETPLRYISYSSLLCLQLDSLEWHKRPLPITLEVAAVKNCVFLLHLQKNVHKALMLPFYQCVDVFLNLVRDADQAEASEHQV
jgi:hypothetical protein